MTTQQRFIKTDRVTRLPIRRLICAIACAFAMLVWTAEPALAKYKGRLNSYTPFTVEITGGTANAGPSVVTVTYLSKRGQIVEFGTAPPGVSTNVIDLQPIPRGTRFIIVEIDSPVGGTAIVRVTQGTTNNEDAFVSDERFVYEIIDGA